MAIDFETSNPDYYYVNTPTAEDGDIPYTILVWYKPESNSWGTLFSSGRRADTSVYSVLQAVASTNAIQWVMRNTSQPFARSTNVMTIGQWNLAIAIELAINSRMVILNGDWANKGTNSTNQSRGAITDTSIGALARSAADENPDGKIAHVAVWKNYAFTEEDCTAAWLGRHPLLIRPDKLSHYWQMLGDGPVNSQVRDMIGKVNLTNIIGSPAKTDSLKLRVGRFF